MSQSTIPGRACWTRSEFLTSTFMRRTPRADYRRKGVAPVGRAAFMKNAASVSEPDSMRRANGGLRTIGLPGRLRGTAVMECPTAAGTCLLHFDVGRPDHLGPFLGLLRNELGEFDG